MQYSTLIAGQTSVLLRVFIGNSSVTTGAGLTGLTNASGGLIAYYIFDGQSTATAITLAAGTVGTWSSGGFKEVDVTHMPGVYEIGLPNAAVPGSGPAKLTLYLSGATNMQNTPVFVDVESGDAFAALTTTTYAQPSAALATPATLTAMISWIATLAKNKITQTATTQTLLKSDGTTTLSTATTSDDGTTVTRGSWT